MEKNKEKELLQVLKDYAVPDPKIVGKLPKGGIQLDFVGHADITRILIEIDPYWSWEPCGWSEGRPAMHVENGMLTMWGWLTIHGKDMLGVGSVKADKMDAAKEVIGDFLRNSAMRFGIALSLWSKQEWEDLGGKPAPQKQVAQPAQKPAKAVSKPAGEPKPAPTQSDSQADEKLPEEQMEKFATACVQAGLTPFEVFKHAGIDARNVKQSDLPALRASFTELKGAK